MISIFSIVDCLLRKTTAGLRQFLIVFEFYFIQDSTSCLIYENKNVYRSVYIL